VPSAVEVDETSSTVVVITFGDVVTSTVVMVDDVVRVVVVLSCLSVVDSVVGGVAAVFSVTETPQKGKMNNVKRKIKQIIAIQMQNTKSPLK